MTDLSPETVGKLVALVRRLRSDFCMSVPLEVLREAQAIVLPEPVDPDLVEAREIAVSFALPGGYDGITGFATKRGDADSKPYVLAVLAAIKRGRALAGGDRS